MSDQMIQDADPDREDRDANREFAEDHSEFQNYSKRGTTTRDIGN